MKNLTLNLKLNLFDEGAAAASSGEAAQIATEGQQTSVQNDGTDNSAVTSEQNNNTGNKTSPDYSDEFNSAIKKGGKYYEPFQRKADEVAARATRTTARKAEQLEKQVQASQKVIDYVSRVTGIKATDTDGLLTALQNNNVFLEKFAMENGMSVNEAKLKIENDMLKENEAVRLRAAAAEENRKSLERAHLDRMEGWMAEGEQVKEKYEKFGIVFDMETELANADFARNLQSTGSVEAAFRAVHFDEIMTARENMAIQRTREETINAVKANRARPSEGAVNTSKGLRTENNVAQTPEDRARIAREMAKGKSPFK